MLIFFTLKCPIHVQKYAKCIRNKNVPMFETKPNDIIAMSYLILHAVSPNYSKKLQLSKPYLKDYSQEGLAPIIIRKLIPEKRNGFFFEAGAFDGEKFSNTLYIEKNRNWTGILVEPLKANYNKLL